MTTRSTLARLLPALLFVCVFTPGTLQAQVSLGVGVGAGPGFYGPGFYGPGPGRYGKYGPPPPANWNYYGLAGGPYLTTGYPFYGWPGYRGANGGFWSNGLSLYGPPVPVYGPIPGVLGNSDFVHQWQARPTLGLGVGYYGWVGPFRASPRPHPSTVSVWPVIEQVAPAGDPVAADAGKPGIPPGGCLYLSVKVPQPAAEVLVDGVKTVQTGTDRLFESPPVEPGKDFAYELTARWVERGVTVERKKVVTGQSGEVVRVDFTAPDVVLTGR
jgi:uncharacterized protein (TIGR03000 family)